MSADDLGAAKRLLALVAHELRAPLAAVDGAATTLRRRGAELGEDDRDRLLALIADESARAGRLAGDLLSAALLEEGRLEVRIESCDAVSVAASVVESARQHLPDSVRLDLASPPGLPAVAADPDRLRQVLANVVENALRYSPPGKSVGAAIEQREQRIRFSVSDTGPGIDPGERDRIFEPFYRGGQVGAGGKGAAGLGLWIARDLVERMGGRIWAEPAESGGTMVVVELPAAGRRATP